MSKKQQVMEALLDSNANLSKQDIVWIATHLPDTTAEENESPSSVVLVKQNYDHSKMNVREALCISEEDRLMAAELLSEVTKDIASKNLYVSQGVEKIIERSTEVNGFFRMIVAKLVTDALNNAEMGIIKSLKDDPEAAEALKQILKRIMKDDDTDKEG